MVNNLQLAIKNFIEQIKNISPSPNGKLREWIKPYLENIDDTNSNNICESLPEFLYNANIFF